MKNSRKGFQGSPDENPMTSTRTLIMAFALIICLMFWRDFDQIEILQDIVIEVLIVGILLLWN